MPPLNEVTPLLKLSLNSIHHVIREEALRVSSVIETDFIYQGIFGTDEYDEIEEENVAAEREVYLSDQISAFKDHVLSHVPRNLMDDLMIPIVMGISQAIVNKKKSWTPTTNMSKFTKAVYAVTKFANLIVVPSATTLDLDKVPKVR